jgi:hypothetical protein
MRGEQGTAKQLLHAKRWSTSPGPITIMPGLAEWQSGYAAACKAVYLGSIPGSASIPHPPVRSLDSAGVGSRRLLVSAPCPDWAPTALSARVAKSVDARDLKSLAARHAGSSPAPGTNRPACLRQWAGGVSTARSLIAKSHQPDRPSVRSVIQLPRNASHRIPASEFGRVARRPGGRTGTLVLRRHPRRRRCGRGCASAAVVLACGFPYRSGWPGGTIRE